jgi:hypothetical protein
MSDGSHCFLNAVAWRRNNSIISLPMKVLIISQSIHSSVHLPFDPKKERWSPVVGCYLSCPGPQSSTPTPQQPRTVGAGKGLRTLESTQCCHGMAGEGAAHDELLILSFPRLCPMHLRYMPLTALILQPMDASKCNTKENVSHG